MLSGSRCVCSQLHRPLCGTSYDIFPWQMFDCDVLCSLQSPKINSRTADPESGLLIPGLAGRRGCKINLRLPFGWSHVHDKQETLLRTCFALDRESGLESQHAADSLVSTYYH